jgi:hypothetical protein
VTSMFGAMVPSETGEWISDKFARLNEILQDYDPHLQLKWIPPDKRTRDDKKPYVVWDTVSDKPVVFAGEWEEPYDVLATVFQADSQKNGHVLDRLTAVENAYKLTRVKEYMDTMEQAADEAKFMMKSPLNTITMHGKKFDDQRRVIGPAVERKHL